MLWKVKSNLSDLIAGKGTRDRILHDFYYLGYTYPFLMHIGYYIYHIEDYIYYGNSLNDVLENLKHDSQRLLSEINAKEKSTVGFKISEFSSRSTRFV